MCKYVTRRTGAEAATPEYDAGANPGVVRFVAHPVVDDSRQAIGHSMAALNQSPGILLARLFGIVIVWVPADGGGVEQQFRPGQGHQTRRFGIPLIPTDQ